jgi:hypothetical protein
MSRVVQETDRDPRRRVRFADEVEEEWSSVLGLRFGSQGFERVDSGVEVKW